MKTIVSLEGLDVIQKNYQQVIIRGDGKEEFNQTVNQEIAMLPPSKNLEVVTNEEHLFSKQSFNQWSLIYLVEQKYKDILKLISNINSKDEILASDYSYGQIYFEVKGENRNEFLNKLTHFDLRAKKFPDFTLAQTLIARIDCSIYNLKEKYIITCNKSFEDYFKERLKDTADIN
jgi:heterotetrameric sarcosine oxidase gamma subunit|tara:strand:- start:117 stop:641 length:525 start_codon:yes stop_codon:yes gene_type:complete